MTLTEIVQRGWDSVAAGDMDTLVAGIHRGHDFHHARPN